MGFKVVRWGEPVKGAEIISNVPLGLIDISSMTRIRVVRRAVTDENGEWFGVAPLALAPALYYMDVTVREGGDSVRISGVFSEISNMVIVDLAKKEYTVEALSGRIPGDGYFRVDDTIITESDLIDVSDDPVKAVSRCSICLYFNRVSRTCVVNGRKGPKIRIEDPGNTTCQLYYPFFLPPSMQRLARDLQRGTPLELVSAMWR